MKGSYCKLWREGTVPLCCVWPLKWVRSKVVIKSVLWDPGACTPCQVPLRNHYSITLKCLQSTILRASLWLAGCPGLLVVLAQGVIWPLMTSEMELMTSWNQNGSHPYSHLLHCTSTNPPRPKGTARNTTFVFGADSWGLLIKRYKWLTQGLSCWVLLRWCSVWWRTGISPRPEFGSLFLSFSKHQLFIKN